MGIFDSSDNSEEEVTINPSETSSQSRDESKLRSEVESKVVPGSKKNDDTVSSVASGSTVSEKKSKEIGMEDVYRQNERIIELLEQLTGNDKNDEMEQNNDNEDFDGDLNGVL